MLEDAEKNAMADKSRKSLVNITYEIDNLLLKSEKLIDTFPSLNKVSVQYFEEVIKQLKSNYTKNKLTQISEKTVKDLKYAYSVLVLEFLKSKLNDKNGAGGNNPDGKGVVIDVTEE